MAKVFYVEEGFSSDRVVVGPEIAVNGILKKFADRVQYVGREIPLFETDRNATTPSSAKYVLFRIEGSYVSPDNSYTIDKPGYYLVGHIKPEEFAKEIKSRE